MQNRLPLIQRLQKQFDENPGLREKCLKNGKDSQRPGMSNRIFDDFPLLLSDEQYQPILQKYRQLYQNGRHVDVRNFEKDLIKIACDEILDGNGNLHPDLIDFLEWTEFAAHIDNHQAVCAFVGMMNLYLIDVSADLVASKQYEFNAMTDCINKNYGQWVREYMREKNIQYNPSHDTDKITAKDVVMYPVRHPLFTLSLFAGGLIGVGIYGAVKGCQEVYNEYAPLSLPEMPKL